MARKRCYIEGLDLIEGVCEAEGQWWHAGAKEAVDKKMRERKTAIGEAFMNGFKAGARIYG